MRERTLVRHDGAVVCERCALAENFVQRLRGLLGRASLGRDEGMMFTPASSIHTWFMRFPIDVVFLDREGAVLSVRERLGPWRAAWQRGARSTLELPAGRCEELDLRAGDVLRHEVP